MIDALATTLAGGHTEQFAVAAADGQPSGATVVATIDPRQLKAGRQVGTIGLDGQLADAAATRRAVVAAEEFLLRSGAEVLRFPVRLTTWHGHRLVTAGFVDEGGPPPFPFEPATPRWLLALAEELGYRVAHLASSYGVPTADYVRAYQFAERRLARSGFTDRPLDQSRLDDELTAIHAIASRAFATSWGFSQISPAEMAAIYRPLAAFAEREFVRIVDDREGQPVGFFFAFVAPLQASGPGTGRLVAKTLAVLPEVARRAPGVGIGLAVAAHRRAAALGYGSAIHALLADGGLTQRLAERVGTRFRRYATLEKQVETR